MPRVATIATPSAIGRSCLVTDIALLLRRGSRNYSGLLAGVSDAPSGGRRLLQVTLEYVDGVGRFAIGARFPWGSSPSRSLRIVPVAHVSPSSRSEENTSELQL